MLIVAAISGCTAPIVERSGTPTPAPDPLPTTAVDPLDGLTLEQRVGQLFMVGTTAAGAEDATLAAVADRHLGNVFLYGRSAAGVTATAAVVEQFEVLVDETTTANVPLLVATDQEGGQVQVLSGPGFSTIPSALSQAALSADELGSSARVWGDELAAAGVSMNLAPVVDLVTSPGAAAANPPIGRYDRQLGYDATTVDARADAFRRGMTAAGVVPVIKHFPGLGTVTANTDTATDVVDSTTGDDSPSVAIYRSQIRAGARAVMVSSAVYSRIDAAAPAVFSPAVITGLLRERLGFDGVVISDDLSSAAQVQAWSPADRAILSIGAGADMVLVARQSALAAEMMDAVSAKARIDPDFADLVDDAARRVIELKESQ